MGLLAGSTGLPLSQPTSCACCGRDLVAILSIARFCPDCGSRIPMPPRRHFTLVRQILPLIHLGRGNVVDDTPTQPGRTAILIGYANALYHLGWRYERGSGTPRNLPEAKRCYTKSARLGNLDAVIRLAPNEQLAPSPVIPIKV